MVKALAFLLLLLMQAAVPVPRKPAKNGASNAQAVQRQTEDRKGQTAPPVPPPRLPNGKGLDNGSHKEGKDNAQSPITVVKVTSLTVKRDVFDWIAWAGNILLVGVGIAGVVVAVRTLRKIERQTAATEKSTEATEKSAAAALRSIELQEAQLHQWVDLSEWQNRTHSVPANYKEATLRIYVEVWNPTSMPLTIKEISTRIADETETWPLTYILSPDETSPVEMSTKVSGNQFNSLKIGNLEVKVSVVVGFIDAFGKSRTQHIEYVCRCGMESIETSPRRNEQTTERQYTNQSTRQNAAGSV